MPDDDAQGIRLEQMPAHTLQSAALNPKLHRDTEIQASLQTFGYVEPVVLDERTGRLVAGHGRVTNVLALEDAGGAPPDGITVDDDGAWCLPVLRGWASANDAEAAAYLVTSNRLTELGGWTEDVSDVLATIQAHADGEQLLGTLGFSDSELQAFLDPDDDPLADVTPDVEEDPYRQQFGLLIPCADNDEAGLVADKLATLGYRARAIQA